MINTEARRRAPEAQHSLSPEEVNGNLHHASVIDMSAPYALSPNMHPEVHDGTAEVIGDLSEEKKEQLREAITNSFTLTQAHIDIILQEF